ncbi:hypothetical protein J6590_003781 [Homalodisca vitripennis]|nr:hypothetical protein J6590_003781 [Homalodisca vitripennis]
MTLVDHIRGYRSSSRSSPRCDAAMPRGGTLLMGCVIWPERPGTGDTDDVRLALVGRPQVARSHSVAVNRPNGDIFVTKEVLRNVQNQKWNPADLCDLSITDQQSSTTPTLSSRVTPIISDFSVPYARDAGTYVGPMTFRSLYQWPLSRHQVATLQPPRVSPDVTMALNYCHAQRQAVSAPGGSSV